MTANMGTIDRMLRFIIGALILVLGVMYGSWWGAIGLVPIFTASIRWCPAYLPFGIRTCRDC